MKKTILLVSLGVMTLVSCQKDFDTDESSGIQQAENVEDMVVASDFDWKTTKSVELNLSSHSNAIVKVLGENGQSLEKAYVPAEQIHKVKLTIPAHQQNIDVMFGKSKVTVPVSGSVINYRQL